MKRAIAVAVVLAVLGVGASPASSSAPFHWTAPQLVDHSTSFGSKTSLTDTACPSSSLCLTVGNAGTVVASGPSGNRVTAGIGGGENLDGITCPSLQLCVASGNRALLVSSDPGAVTPSWQTALPTPHGEDGVTCPSASLCLAWGDNDTVVVSQHPTGGASTWHAATLATGSHDAIVTSIGCVPSTTSCVASLGEQDQTQGARFATSSNPAGGAGAWKITSAPGAGTASQLVCPSTSLCLGLGTRDIETSTDPMAGARSWTAGTVIPVSSFDLLVALACPSATQCVATTDGGTIATSASPAEGASSFSLSAVIDSHGFAGNGIGCRSTTTCLSPDSAPGLATLTLGDPPSATVATDLAGTTAVNGLACPEVSLCLGVDSNGTILRTARPGGPASGWRALPQPAAHDGLAAISCAGRSFCAAVGPNDTVETSSSPGGSTSWRGTHLPFHESDRNTGVTNDNLLAVSCASSRLCVAGVDQSRLIVTTHPSAGASAWKVVSVGSQTILDSVSCASTTFCVAGDSQFGDVAVSTDPSAKGSWKVARISPGNIPAAISAVSCPSTRFCLATDDSGAIDVSTHPAAGARAWKRVKLGQVGLVAASCRSSHFCVVVDKDDDAYVSTNPTGPRGAWRATVLTPSASPVGNAKGLGLTAVACAPAGVCLAATKSGLVFAGQ